MSSWTFLKTKFETLQTTTHPYDQLTLDHTLCTALWKDQPEYTTSDFERLHYAQEMQTSYNGRKEDRTSIDHSLNTLQIESHQQKLPCTRPSNLFQCNQ